MILLNTIASSRRRPSVTYDIDASSYFTAVEAVSSIGTVAKNAANALIVGLKADGLWTLIHQLYLYAGPNTLAGALVKAKGSGSRTNNGFVSGDFSPTLGLQGSGAKYISNGFLASALAPTSHSLFFYGSNYTISGSSSSICGVWTGSAPSLMAFDTYTIEPVPAGRAYRCGTFSFPASPIITTGLTTSGSIMASKTASNSTKIYQNGISAAASTASSTPTPPSIDFWSFAFNYSNAIPTAASTDRRQVEAFAQGLDATQAQQLHDLTTTYVNALNA
jgi:hypothetical protein